MSSEDKIRQLNNALNSAVSSINLARNLLKDLEGQLSSDARLRQGPFGKFTGEFAVMDDGQKLEVPQNYASKSMLVYGDKLKMYEEGGEKRFKQVERVKRLRVEGILAKKEGRWHAVTADGSYRVLDSAVEHFGGKEGSQVTVLLPLEDKYAPFAAIEFPPAPAKPVMGEQKAVLEKPKEEVTSITPPAVKVSEAKPLPAPAAPARENAPKPQAQPGPQSRPQKAPVKVERVIRKEFSGTKRMGKPRNESDAVSAPPKIEEAPKEPLPALTEEDLR